MVEVRQYVDQSGRNPFQRWFQRQSDEAQARVTISLARVRNGNLSNAKALGAGILELRLHFGPGYRVYFGMDGQTLVILLAAVQRSAGRPTS